MSQKLWSAVESYFDGLLIPPDPVLDAVLKACAAAGLPNIAVTPSQGQFLNLIARIRGARRILEIGTLGGYSTIWLARALPADGRVVTIEADPKHFEVARANIARAGLAGVVEQRLGSAAEVLPVIDRTPFDLIFIDADKDNYPTYFHWAMQLSHAGTVILIDNVVREGEVVNARSTDPRVQGVRLMNEAIAAEPRVSATTIQTVGPKGYDGLILALRTS